MTFDARIERLNLRHDTLVERPARRRGGQKLGTAVIGIGRAFQKIAFPQRLCRAADRHLVHAGTGDDLSLRQAVFFGNDGKNTPFRHFQAVAFVTGGDDTADKV